MHVYGDGYFLKLVCNRGKFRKILYDVSEEVEGRRENAVDECKKLKNERGTGPK